MKFYHSTTQSNATSIEKSNHINPSQFDIMEYLVFLLQTAWFPVTIGEHRRLVDKYVSATTEETHSVMWLGQGIYCFGETDLQEAQKYRDKLHDAVIEIITEDVTVYNMDARGTRRELYDFLEQGFNQLRSIQTEQQDVKLIDELRDLLKASLLNNFSGTPYAAGVLLEIFGFVTDRKPEIVTNTFLHGGTAKQKVPWLTKYFVIKEPAIVRSLKTLSE